MRIDNLEIRFSSIEYNQKNKELIQKIIEMADAISKSSRRGSGNYMVIGSDMQERLENFQIGHKGSEFLEAGYIYSPVIPIMDTPTIITNHGI